MDARVLQHDTNSRGQGRIINNEDITRERNTPKVSPPSDFPGFGITCITILEKGISVYISHAAEVAPRIEVMITRSSIPD